MNGHPCKILALFLLLGAAAIPRASAQAADCETAFTQCKAQCGQSGIFNMEQGQPVEQSDFKEKCETSCTAGLESCRQQDSKNACSSFYYHCGGGCPSTVAEQPSGSELLGTNAFYQCAMSCKEGKTGCEKTQTAAPEPRKRSGAFEGCAEARLACETTCVANGSPLDDAVFPEKCRKACAAGVPGCQKEASPPAGCNASFFSCAAECPDVEKVDGDYKETSDDGNRCLNACSAGSQYCHSIAG